MSKKKILIAAGGTGGHLFPAQALADDLVENEILFSGSGLSTNRCFAKERFAYQDINAATPRNLFSLKTIFKGIIQSLRLIATFKPDMVIGFGSFHSFPLLVAAVIKRIPIVLFEPNSIPGKVNRLFARFAKVNAVQFLQAGEYLKGKIAEVSVPAAKKRTTRAEAHAYFSLNPSKLTVLVFGGSQGAAKINQLFCEAAGLIKNFQVIHFTGKQTSADEIRRQYAHFGIEACVKDFEYQMHYAWSAADLVVCRAGAATLAEQIAFEVPGILIPYPHATDDHQKKNALFIEERIGGAVHVEESALSAESMKGHIIKAFESLGTMKEKIQQFKNNENKQNLANLVKELL